MRSNLPYLLATLLGLGCAACSIEIDLDGSHFHEHGGYNFNHRGVSDSRHEEGSFESAPESVTVENKFGNLEVVSTGSDYGWSWDGKVWAEDEAAAQRFLQELSLRIEQDGGRPRLVVHLPDPDDDLNGVESNLRLRLPAAAAAELRNEFGATSVRELQGRVAVHSQFGEVQVRAAHDVDVECSFGKVEVDGADAVNLRNEHAAITAQGVRGNAEVHGSFGAVKLECAGAEVVVENEFADVEVSLSNRDARRVEIRNSFGPIELTVPSSAAHLDLENSFGDVDTFLDLRDQDDSPFETRMVGGAEDAALRVRLSNEHGSIRVRRG